MINGVVVHWYDIVAAFLAAVCIISLTFVGLFSLFRANEFTIPGHFDEDDVASALNNATATTQPGFISSKIKPRVMPYEEWINEREDEE